MERPDLQRIRAATVAAVVTVRAAVAATLAYAFSPALGLVALATLLDAGAGLDTGLRAVRGADRSRWLLWLELAARGVLLWLARREVFGGPSVATFSHRSWAGGSLGAVLVWFAPIAIGRIATALLASPWRAPRLHVDERARWPAS